MKSCLKPFFTLALLASSAAIAQVNPLMEIYPFKPYPLNEMREKIMRMTEDPRPVMNVYDMERRSLLEKNTAVMPWGGFYWALNQGQAANTWQDKNYFQFWELLSWQVNVKRWKKRKQEVLSRVNSMSEKDLAELAPSEKYDLLLGDTSFDLSSRIWQFVETWGNTKKWGFLSSIDIPAGYRIPKANRFMATWEGICHGWALAAGGTPRPTGTVTITLPNGKKMPFYPDDIKALISLTYANSIVQDNVIVEGLRCNDKRPEQDQYGRYVDELPVKEGEEVLPRCADVHPAVWHTSLVNLTGLQGRSFVVEIDANATVNNHPLSGYKFEWFNPKTGKTTDLAGAVINLADYKDPYKSSRSPHATKLVGVDMEMRYIQWRNPHEEETDSEENDKVKDSQFMYDLELDAQGNIVGGQWRATRTAQTEQQYNAGQRVGGGSRNGAVRRDLPSIKQPDFFWTLPKNYQSYFKPLDLEPWDGRNAAPKSWLAPAISAHSFVYQVTRDFGFNEKCTVLPENGGSPKEVPCEFKYPRPQPLINVVNKLLEMSRR